MLNTTVRVEPVRLCLSEHLSTCCSSKTNTMFFRQETLLMQPTFICWPTVILILFYSSAFPRNITHQVCLCVVCACSTAVGSAGRRSRAVVLRLAAVRGFSLAVEPCPRCHVHLPGRCCGGQRESFGDGCRYVNTPRKNLESRPAGKNTDSGSDHLRSDSCTTTESRRYTTHNPKFSLFFPWLIRLLALGQLVLVPFFRIVHIQYDFNLDFGLLTVTVKTNKNYFTPRLQNLLMKFSSNLSAICHLQRNHRESVQRKFVSLVQFTCACSNRKLCRKSKFCFSM